MAVVVDETRYPIVVVTFPTLPSDEDVRTFIEANRRYLDREQRHCTILDMRQIMVASPPLRHQIADYIRENHDSLLKWRAGTVFVNNTAIARGITAAIIWLQRPPTPGRPRAA
jgi:hypothetical protein